MVFEAKLFKDGRIIYDRYLDEISEDEIRDEVSKCLDDVWDYYIDGSSLYAFKLNERNKNYSLNSYVDLTTIIKISVHMNLPKIERVYHASAV